MNLDETQRLALRFLHDVEEDHRPTVVIKGPAGTGKSAIISEFMRSCGSQVIVAAPTHKACDVLRQRGVSEPKTIHSLLYKMVDEVEEIQIFDPETQQPMLDEEGKEVYEERVIGQKWLPRDIPIDEMVVFEEASMIGNRMLDDIGRVTTRRAFVGDHFQLPPVKDVDVFHIYQADVELSKVYRLKESGPLALATALRLGQPAQPHLFDIPVLPRTSSTLERVVEVDGQVIVWKNVTRRSVNASIRQIRGAKSWKPEPGDRVVFCETDRDIGVYNGLNAEVVETLSADNFHCKIKVITDAGEYRIVTCPSEPFMGQVFRREERRKDSDPIHIEYAYAMTCHKMQGSEHPEIFVIDDTAEMKDRLGRETTVRWLYTAVTRTSKNLTIMR